MKRFFLLLFTAVFLITMVPMESFAASKEALNIATDVAAPKAATSSVSDPTDEALSKVILNAKEKITIPKNYSIFNYYYYSSGSYSQPYWTLSWTDPDNNGSISVNIDTDNHIIGYGKSDNSKATGGVAKYFKSDLESTADSFLAKIAPEIYGSLKLVSSEYTNVYSGDYIYTFERVYNGISLPDNTVTVSVNSISGEVSAANINWLYSVSIPSVKDTISKEKATSIIKKNLKMKLIYRSNYMYAYDKYLIPGTTDAYLVYEPTENYISVDAVSGKVYTSNSRYTTNEAAEKDAAAGYGAMNGMAKSETASTVSLTDNEIKKIKELKNLISKSKEISLITGNKSLYRDDNLTQKTANLNKVENNGSTSYVWNVSLNDPRKTTNNDYYRGYAYATVDAQTGKILSYYASMSSIYDPAKQNNTSIKIKYNKKQSKSILEKFLKEQAGSRFNESVFAGDGNDYVIYYSKETPVYGGYSFVYNRTYEGIEYPDNTLSGSVDGVTGKIYSFGSNWNSSVKFQPAKNIITADQAMNYYLGNDGYGLKYEINQITNYSEKTGNTSVKNEVRLVYRPDVTPAYISPFTGEQLDYSGTVYKKTKSYSYKDITNTALNKNILLLADMNIGFDGDNFSPNQNITVGELKTLLSSIGYNSNTIDMEDGSVITRQEMAQLFINWLGLDKLSKLTIYDSGYADKTDVNPKYAGAVALAKGFGIMSGDSNNLFHPTSNVTRFDAVNMVCNFIEVQKNGVLY